MGSIRFFTFVIKNSTHAVFISLLNDLRLIVKVFTFHSRFGSVYFFDIINVFGVKIEEKQT